MSTLPDEDAITPPIDFTRLLVVVTGSSAASSLTYWLDWISSSYPELRVKVLLTRSATGFVGLRGLEARLGDDLLLDSWEGDRVPDHAELARWSDVIIVFPATHDWFSRFAAGTADAPSLTITAAHHGVTAIVPSFPAGVLESPPVQRTWQRLARQDDVVLVAPILGDRLYRDAQDNWVAATMSDAFAMLTHRRRERAGFVQEQGERTGEGGTQSYGTHLLRTSVAPAEGGGFWWCRRTGDRAESVFAPHPASPVEPSADAMASVRWGIGDDRQRWYHSEGSDTLASILLALPFPDETSLDALSAAGRALRALHDASIGGAGPTGSDVMSTRLSPRPRPLARLLRWFDDRATTPLGARLRRNAATVIGETALTRLRDRLTVTAAPHRLRVVHGAPGLGSIVLGPGGTIDLLTGEDVALSSPMHDVNWLIGELTELSWLSADSEAWKPAIEAVLSGYGSDEELIDNDLIAARILLHAHDYVSYVRWDENAQEQYLRFVAHLAGSGG